MTPALAAFRAFIPPRAPGDFRDRFSVVIAHDAPVYASQESVELLGALTRAVMEENDDRTTGF